MLTDFANLLNNDDRETIFEYFEEKLEKYDWCVPLHDWHQNVVDAVISMLFWLKRTKIIQFDELALYTRLDELDEEAGKFWWAFTLYSPECRGSEEIMEAMGGGDRVFLHQQYSKYFHGNIFQRNTDDLCDLIELCEQLKLGIEFTQYSLSCWDDEKVLSSEPPMFFIFEKNGYANYGHSYFHSTKVPIICEQEVEKSMFVITLKNHPQGIYSVFDAKDERIVPLFMEGDDADRYVMQLAEDEENPELEVLEAEAEHIINSCRAQNQKYSIITPDDLIIPPDVVTKE